MCVLISGRKDSRGRKGMPEQGRDKHEEIEDYLSMHCVVCTKNKIHYITNGINLFLPSINLHVKDMHCHFACLVGPAQ